MTQTEIAPPRPRLLSRSFGSLLRFVRRRPLSTLVVLLLLLAFAFFASRELTFQSQLKLARREVERGHNAAAAPRLAVCRSIHASDAELLLLCATTARRSGLWEEAESLLDEYSKAHGDDDALAFERISLRATRGDLESSAPLLLARIEAGGDRVRAAREALVTGLLHRFRWIEADRNLAAWLQSTPDDTFALMLRGKLDEQRLQTAAALANFKRVVELDPEHDEARLRTTTLLLQQRQTEELVGHLEHLRRRMPHLPEVRIQWVKALALQGRSDESREALESCLKEFPDFAPALAERGGVALQAGDDKTAEEFLGRAAAIAPGDFTTRSQYAAVLARNGKAAEAARERESLRQLEADVERIGELIAGPLQTRPNDPAVPHEIAVIALRSGQAAEGLRWLQAALLVDPGHGPSHQILANYYQASGNPALAAKHRALARQYSKKS